MKWRGCERWYAWRALEWCTVKVGGETWKCVADGRWQMADGKLQLAGSRWQVAGNW